MAVARRKSPVLAAFAWWFAALAAGLPATLRRALGLERAQLILDLDGDDVRLGRRRGNAWEDLGHHRPDLELVDADVIVRLPAQAGLRREIEIPIAAAESLPEALGYEVERQTPFRTDQVHFAYRELARDAAAGIITVDLLVVPREQIRMALDTAARLGFTPTAMTAGADAAALDFNLLPARPRQPAPASRSATLLWAIAAACLVLALATPFFRVELARREAESRLVAAEAAARPILEQRARLGDREETLRSLVRRNAAGMSTVVLLEELTRVLPDDASLSQLAIRKDGVELHGTAASAAAVVSRLDSSGRYEAIAFRSPVVRDPVTGLERFHLAARFRAAAG
jgi:general secretion pathway protein L